MPFTPLHLGPALLVALLVYPLLDTPTFLVASIMLDLEPLAVFLLGLQLPLHGPFHSLVVSGVAGLLLALVMYLLRGRTKGVMEATGLPQGDGVRRYLVAGLLGAWGHVLLDALVYSDLTLVYPWDVNPLFGLVSESRVVGFCVASFSLSIVVYFVRFILIGWVRSRGSEEPLPTEPAETYEPSPGPFMEAQAYGEEPALFFDFPEPEAATEPEPEPMEAVSPAPTAPEPEPEHEPEPEPEPVTPPEPEPIIESTVQPDIYLGSDRMPEQWGIIGKAGEDLVAVDLNEPHIVFVCGKQGSGKGYTIGVISEMLLSKSIQGISQVRKPATIIVFHKPRDDLRSEFWSIADANTDRAEAAVLMEGYGVGPRQVITKAGFRIFVDPFVYQNERKKFEDDYGTKVYPIGINPTRLTAEDWPHVLSLGKKSGSMYVKKIFQIIKKTQYDRDFGLNTIRRNVDASDLNPNQKGFAMMRLETLEDYLVAGDFMGDLIIGGVNVFDLRKIMMEPDDVFSVMMLVISALINNDNTAREQFVFVINEAHDYLRKGLSKDFTDYVNYLIRKKRHAGTWLMLDTHFPEDVDPKVIKGSDVKIFHKSDVISSSLLKQIVDGTTVEPHQLNTGQAIVRADKSNLGPDTLLILEVRPRLTHHGGATKTAV
ncbi:hypothetical protein JXL21_00640 [Candidatus Bathyarchaeota archaeon]|nr:hypothetical protein [Candidatus Bathyarchaeota archaeon]